jgi:regulator of PEP synthase PpsR (kinase-PPPase family)
MLMSILSVYIISDSLGETGEQVAKAAISQFELDDYEIKRFPYVLNLKLLSEILK